jgi:hypothetical protein
VAPAVDPPMWVVLALGLRRVGRRRYLTVALPDHPADEHTDDRGDGKPRRRHHDDPADCADDRSLVASAVSVLPDQSSCTARTPGRVTEIRSICRSGHVGHSRSEQVVGVDDPIGVTLLGEEPLPMRSVVSVEGVA